MPSFETADPVSIPRTPQSNLAANFDSIARAYRWMEYLSFGPMLERCRFHFLPRFANARHALILGDGDGRFTARFLLANRAAQVEAVDASHAMLASLHQRAYRADSQVNNRLKTIQADLRGWTPSGKDYDLVVSHFFLDCLTTGEVDNLIERTLSHLTEDAAWLVSEFSIPKNRLFAACAGVLIRFLYFAFARMTHLRVTRLPDYAAALSRHGFRRQEQRQFLAGLLISEIWIRDCHFAGPDFDA